MRDSSTDNNTPAQGKRQAQPQFDWPKLRKAAEKLFPIVLFALCAYRREKTEG